MGDPDPVAAGLAVHLQYADRGVVAMPSNEILSARHPNGYGYADAQTFRGLEQFKAVAHDCIAVRGTDGAFNQISNVRVAAMQRMQLGDNAIVTRYEDIGRPVTETSAQARQRAQAAIAANVLDSRNEVKRMPRGTNGADPASMTHESDRHARGRGPPFRRDDED